MNTRYQMRHSPGSTLSSAPKENSVIANTIKANSDKYLEMVVEWLNIKDADGVETWLPTLE